MAADDDDAGHDEESRQSAKVNGRFVELLRSSLKTVVVVVAMET